MIKNKRFTLAALLLAVSLITPSLVSAATMNGSIRLGRLMTSYGGSGQPGNDLYVTVKFASAPTTVGKIVITFPSGFTLTAGTPTPVTTGAPNTPTGTTPLPGTLASSISSAGAGAGGTFTITGMTSASLTTTNTYEFSVPDNGGTASYIQNPSTAGQYLLTMATQTTGAAPIDTVSIPTYVTDNSTQKGDQVTVNASVAPNFQFNLLANSDTVPPADPTTIVTSPGVTMNVATNSPLGYTAYVKSANGYLKSTGHAADTNYRIPTGTFSASNYNTVTKGSTFYGFVPQTGAACVTCVGTPSYDPTYSESGTGGAYITSNGTSTSKAGAFNGTNFSSFVSRSGPTGYTDGDQINLRERVAVNAAVPFATDYTDTLTIVAAGNF